MMRNKFALVSFLFFVFIFFFSSIKIDYVSARQIVDVGNPGNNDFTGADVAIPLDNKLVLKNGTPVKDVFNSTDDMINLIVKVVFVGAGFFLFLMIIGAGFSMVQGDSKDKDKAKTTMTSAAVGFMIMFGAFWIMQIIQLITGVNMGFN